MRQIPNLLSLLRIGLIPAFVWSILSGQFIDAVFLLALSALTDFLDGFVARQFGWESRLGIVLDPLADKATHIALSVALLLCMPVYTAFFVVLACKELLMLVLGGYLISQGGKLTSAHWYGKISTALLYLTAFTLLLVPGLSVPAGFALLTVTTLCSITAGLLYFPQFYRSKRALNRKKHRK